MRGDLLNNRITFPFFAIALHSSYKSNTGISLLNGGVVIIQVLLENATTGNKIPRIFRPKL